MPAEESLSYWTSDGRSSAPVMQMDPEADVALGRALQAISGM